MANPRQRRKAKSSSHKAVSHSKRAKRLQKKMPSIRGPKALQDAWNPSKTVRQNYLALGLEHDLNPISSGGSELNITRTIGSTNTHPPPATSSEGIRSSVSQGLTVTSTLPKGFGRIIRDPSGNVVRVDLPDDDDVEYTSNRDPVIDPPVVTKESDLRIWAHDHLERDSGGMEDVIVQDLENLAASAIIRERHVSLGEKMYLERLVGKYGDDIHKMARDRRLNPDQRTANELKRAVARAGGFGALSKSMITEVTE